jgi:pyruvate/2-oxoglutarate dehydrogenase complex dihydrolipoamide dehydrogenase (E3) component
MGRQAFEAIVVGTGQSGPALASRLARAGRRVAVIERGAFGGTCVNVGCTPTKALVASAYAAHMARRGADYGVVVPGPVTVDMKKVMARKNEIVGRSRGGVERWMRTHANIAVFTGHGRFAGPGAIEVGGDVLEAPSIFLNVGGRSAPPAGVAADGGLTSETVLDLDVVPEHLVVVGGSYIGLEFAQVFRRFGSRVTIVEKGPRLIGREDRDVSEGVRAILEAEGIEVRVNASCISATRVAGGVAVGIACGEGPPAAVGSHVLYATGRVPNTDDLGLDRAGIRTDERGFIVVDDELRASAPGVWVLGDANGRGAFTHTSYNDYEIVAANVLDGARRKVTERLPIYGLFIDPPLGRVGLTVEQAKRGGARVLVGKRPMTRVGRAVERGESQGFMKVLVDADSRRILGAAVLGASGDEAVQTLVDAMMAGLTADQVIRGVRIHPTVGELLPTILGELREPADADF